MPKLKESAVAVVGTIIDIENLTNFDTKKPDGSMKVVVASGDGFAAVKLAPDEAREVTPNFGTQIGWMVRFGAFQRGDSDAQATCRYVRSINENDLDRLVSAAGVPTPSGK